MKKKYLDDKETSQMIRDAEAGQFVDVPDFKRWNKMLMQTAKNTIKARKNKSVTIRISEEDLAKLKIRASLHGMPYQTLLTSLIHQYNNDKVKMQAL